MNADRTEQSRRFSYLPALVLAITSMAALWVRIRMLSAPLERDEGEYAYMAQLFRDGVAPYLKAYSMKLPGVGIVYSLFISLFGETAWGIHLGLLFVNAACALLVFLLGRRLLGGNEGFLAAAALVALSLSKSVYGIHAHATQFVTLFSLAGFTALLAGLDRRRTALVSLSGLCFGIAYIMKQPAAILILFALGYLVLRGRRSPGPAGKLPLSGIFLFLAGVAFPFGMVVLWTASRGTFGRFWFWTVTYAAEYVTGLPWEEGIKSFTGRLGEIGAANLPLWLLAATGIAFLASRKLASRDRLFLGGLFLFSFLAACPGLYFRSHYFVPLLPAAALLAAAAAAAIGSLLGEKGLKGGAAAALPSLLMAAGVAYGFIYERVDYFERTPAEVSYWTFGESPFAVAPAIGAYLKEHTSPDDTIAVLGSEPEILFYAQRRSATGHIYMYGLMEDHPYAERMQRELIREVEANRPRYCVFTRLDTSWLARPSSSRTVLTWFDSYSDHYEKVGAVDLVNDTAFTYWDAAAAGHTAATKGGLVIYRRKD